jgi:hypothetical protein
MTSATARRARPDPDGGGTTPTHDAAGDRNRNLEAGPPRAKTAPDLADDGQTHFLSDRNRG